MCSGWSSASWGLCGRPVCFDGLVFARFACFAVKKLVEPRTSRHSSANFLTGEAVCLVKETIPAYHEAISICQQTSPHVRKSLRYVRKPFLEVRKPFSEVRKCLRCARKPISDIRKPPGKSGKHRPMPRKWRLMPVMRHLIPAKRRLMLGSDFVIPGNHFRMSGNLSAISGNHPSTSKNDRIMKKSRFHGYFKGRQRRDTVLPLLGGEGRGEDGRSIKFLRQSDGRGWPQAG
jgi:hypothetical protein